MPALDKPSTRDDEASLEYVTIKGGKVEKANETSRATQMALQRRVSPNTFVRG